MIRDRGSQTEMVVLVVKPIVPEPPIISFKNPWLTSVIVGTLVTMLIEYLK